MTPARLKQCLTSIHWSPEALAEVLECDLSLVNAWLDGAQEVPIKTQAWLSTLALAHKSLEDGRPKSLKGKRYKPPHDA